MVISVLGFSCEKQVDAAKDLGLKMKCVITSMDQPIGRTVGNAVEIEESVACLKGSGPADLVELVTHLGNSYF